MSWQEDRQRPAVISGSLSTRSGVGVIIASWGGGILEASWDAETAGLLMGLFAIILFLVAFWLVADVERS